MGGCCVGNCCVMNFSWPCFFDGGGGCGYNPGPSKTEAHAKKIADELADMKKNVRKSSEAKEEEIINEIDGSMNELIQMLKKINKQTFGGKSLNINIQGICEKNEELKNEVVGYIGNIMEERLVLTDKELSVILQEPDDKKRARSFKSFCKRIQKNALSGLSEKIECTVRKQENMVRKEIESRLDEVEKNMREATKAYTEIVNVKEKDQKEMEKTQMKYVYKYELTKVFLDQLES